MQFLSTPSGWRATPCTVTLCRLNGFLSTPSGWRATVGPAGPQGPQGISIHALRVEGDALPPLSCPASLRDFYPRPPGGGRRVFSRRLFARLCISIHALRVEGDRDDRKNGRCVFCISIHALRVEGDITNELYRSEKKISIHALRVEGDGKIKFWMRQRHNFYPRPPGGGRQICHRYTPPLLGISIHALRVEGDLDRLTAQIPHLISIHALRVEGDQDKRCDMRMMEHFYPRPPGGGRRGQHIIRIACIYKFLSTPSGWRATAKTDKVFVCFCAKGRRICLFKTRKEKICRWRFKKDKFWVLIWCEGSGKSVCASASHCG